MIQEQHDVCTICAPCAHTVICCTAQHIMHTIWIKMNMHHINIPCFAHCPIMVRIEICLMNDKCYMENF